MAEILLIIVLIIFLSKIIIVEVAIIIIIMVTKMRWEAQWPNGQCVQVRAPAGDIVLCSWARHFTLTVPLSTQEYKWVPAIC